MKVGCSDVTRHDNWQWTMHGNGAAGGHIRQFDLPKRCHTACKRKLEGARVMMESNLSLQDFLTGKSNHKNIGVGLKSLSIGKVRKSPERGVTPLRDLIDSVDPVR